jgi:hypothetical protein
MKIDLDSKTLKLHENPNVSHDDGAEMYSCYGAHISTEEHGDICVQAVDYDWMDAGNDSGTWRTEQLAALDRPSEGDFGGCDDKPNDLADALARGDEEDIQAWIDYLRSEDDSQEGLQDMSDALAVEIESVLEQVREINHCAEKTDDYAILMLHGEGKLSWDECEGLVALARRIRRDMDEIDEVLEEASMAAADGDLAACVEALRNARSLETDHGDDPSTMCLASQLLAEME